MNGSLALKIASLLALVTFAHTSAWSLLSLALILAGVVAAFLGERVKAPWTRLGVGVVLVLFLAFTLGPQPPEGHHFFEPSVSAAYQGGLVAGFTVVALMVWQLSGAQVYFRIAATLGLMLAAGVVRESFPFAYFVAAVTVCILIFLRTRHKARPLTVGSLVATALILALASSIAIGLKWSETKMSLAFDLLSGSSGSTVFSPRADLQWARRRQTSTRLVARVFAKKSPVHMAGMRYLSYANGGWQAMPGKDTVRPQHDPRLPRGLFHFRVSEVEPASETMRVELAVLPALSLLHPTPTSSVALNVDSLKQGALGTLYLTPNTPFNGTYLVAPGEGASPAPTEEVLKGALSLPPDCPPQVFHLARELVEDAPSPVAAVRQVEGYFQANFEYGFGNVGQQGENIVEVFLRDKPPAHCELFATSAALVLRAGGIPTRYVNGFLVAEKSRFGDTWLTRDRDAHAWVEAYLPGHGWVTVDPTPPSALSSPPVAAWRETVEWLVANLKSGFRKLRSQPLDFLQSVPGVILLLLVCWVVGRRLRWPRRTRKKPAEAVAPELSRLQELFKAFQSRQRELERPEKGALTVLEWAHCFEDDERTFLQRYSEVRYSRSVPQPAEVKELEQIWEEIQEHRASKELSPPPG